MPYHYSHREWPRELGIEGINRICWGYIAYAPAEQRPYTELAIAWQEYQHPSHPWHAYTLQEPLVLGKGSSRDQAVDDALRRQKIMR